MTALPHPPYSPDLSPCHFFLFSHIKWSIKGRQFNDLNKIKGALTAQLTFILEEAFQRFFQDLQRHWNHCITVTRYKNQSANFWDKGCK